MLQMYLLVLSLTAVSFGGGNILLSGLERDLVQTGRISPQQFGAAVALGNSTPGPLAAFAPAIAMAAAGLGGAVGAALGLLTVSTLSIWLIRLIPARWFDLPRVRAGLSAIQPLAAALVIFVGGRSLFAGMALGPSALSLGVAAGVVLGRARKVPVPLLVIAAVAIGMAVV